MSEFEDLLCVLGGPRASFAYELAINAEKLRYAEHAEETLATEDTTRILICWRVEQLSR